MKTIETKIAKNGSTRYYVREEIGKLRAIRKADVWYITCENEREYFANLFGNVTNDWRNASARLL